MTTKEKITLKGITLTVILIGVFYFGIKQFQDVQFKILQTNDVIASQQIALENIKKEIRQLQEINREELNKLKMALSAEKENRVLSETKTEKEKEIAQKQISDLKKKMTDAEQISLTNIIHQWESYVVMVECDFYSHKTGELFIQTSGSGLLTKWKNTSVAVLTNKHIITPLSLGMNDVADQCVLKFPKQDISIASDKISVLTDNFDWGLIIIDSQNEYIDELMQKPPYLCAEDPVLGDEIAILGYPNIGDEKNVTVTDGIISGFDENYFITSAKVEKGNSGGAAISLKNNCYLGTPTFSRAGSIESLARILDVKVLFE